MQDQPMTDYTEQFHKAIERTIKENHALGLPVYQVKNGYIIAIYPGGREAVLQKATPFYEEK